MQESHFPFSVRLRILIQHHWKRTGTFNHILTAIFLFYVLCIKTNIRVAVHCYRRTSDYLTKLVHPMLLCSFKRKADFKKAVSTAKLV
jgi:hypothetical protein